MSSIPSSGLFPAVLPPKQIRFVNNEGHPPAKRRRISAACRTCRKRKTRCDGKRPICSTCQDNNHVCFGYSDTPDLQSGPPKTETHGRNGEEEHCFDEEEKDKSSGTFTQRSPQKAEKRTECLNMPILKPSSSIATKDLGRIDSELIKEENQGVPAFPENESAPLGNSSRRRLVAIDADMLVPDATPPVQVESHRVPYFRYFGPTAIVPGYKAMVVAVPSKEVRRSVAPTPAPSPGSGGHSGGSGSGGRSASQASSESRSRIETPTYDPDPENQVPVNRLIIHLVEVFFLRLGCNYPFLKQKKFVAMVEEKQVDAILVNAVCALAARFSDHPLLTIPRDRNICKSEYGSVFASRAKAAVVDTFPCPSVAAVQACLLLAYEGFGSDEDSALWMYLGCAIRMAQDLGLQKLDRVKDQTKKYQESSSPNGQRKPTFDFKMVRTAEADETEKEHIDTLWAVFILDRLISSGTGRAVTLKDEEFDLAFPELTFDVETGWPAPFPVLIQIIHLYGRVSDLINNIRSLKDMTSEKMEGLSQFEKKLTAIYQMLDHRLTFNATNFQHYVKAGQGTNFILLHFWFHTLIMLLHQPTLLHSFEGRIQQLLPNSRELSMSSAKTIADILAFAELIDPRSFIGNPFTSQPIYIAACAFLMESVAHSSQPTSRDASPPRSDNQDAPRSETSRNPKSSAKAQGPRKAAKKEKFSLLATAANQNYQRCYKALEQLEKYWAGARYIITALDQKAKGIWDPETYTTEQMESTKLKAESQMHSWRNNIPSNFSNPAGSPNNFRGVLSPLPVPASPLAVGMTVDLSQALGWSLSGITNSPNSNLAFLYQPIGVVGDQAPPSQPTTAGTLIYDPIRQSVPETRPNIQSTSYNPPYLPHRNSSSSSSQSNAQGMLPPGPKYNSPITKADTSDAEMLLNLTSPFSTSPSASGSFPQLPQHSTSYERSSGGQPVISPSHLRDSKTSVQINNSPSSAVYNFGTASIIGSSYSGTSRGGGYTAFSGYGYGGGLGMGMVGEMMITSQDIDMSALGGEMMPWLQDYLPSDMMNFFDNRGGTSGNAGSG